MIFYEDDAVLTRNMTEADAKALAADGLVLCLSKKPI